MNLESIGKLLNTIAVNYPRVRSEISNKDGTKIRMDVLQEWQRQIGYLDYEETLARLDNHMSGPNGAHAPKPMDLKTAKGKPKDETFHAPIEHQWHLEFMKWDENRMHGRLYDEEEREYVHDPRYEEGYHYDQNGRICTIDGRVVH